MLSREELPEEYPTTDPAVECVCITYKRIIGYYKNERGDMTPAWGGSIARYPRDLGFRLDQTDLLPTMRK